MASTFLNPDYVCFVNGIFIANPETPEKIDLSDAVYNMCCLIVDDVKIPEGMKPEDLMLIWNRMVDSMNRYQDGIVPDDDDEI